MNPFESFVRAAAAQVETVITNTKTAATIIFLAGMFVGAVLF